VQALAGVLGGTQSLHTDSYDEALALPSDAAVTVALRTQQILAEESGVTHSVDPLAGSYFVENLTNRVERQALDYIERIDEMGGIIAAIERGYPQKEIADASYKYQQQIEDGTKTIVGVNKYVQENEIKPKLLRIDDSVEHKQVARLATVKAERDAGRLDAALSGLRKASAGDDNLIPLMLDAVRAHATVGEICESLVPAFGRYQETSVL